MRSYVEKIEFASKKERIGNYVVQHSAACKKVNKIKICLIIVSVVSFYPIQVTAVSTYKC